MSQLIQLKQKIGSTGTIKKITHAVRLVSMSLYSKLEKKKKSIENYKNNIISLFNYVQKFNPESRNKILFPDDLKDSTPLFIIVSTSKGLCGSLNSNLLRYLKQVIILEKHQQAHFIIIGTKSQKFIEKLNLSNPTKLHCSYNEVNAGNYQSMTKEILQLISTSKIKFSSVSFFSNKIRNFFYQEPHKTTLIPANIDMEETKDTTEPIWEESTTEISNYLSSSYLKSTVLGILYEAIISEQAARFIAMDGATSNAEKYLDELVLQYNKSRQTLITREVSELSSGSQN